MAEEDKKAKYFELKLPRITFKDTQINIYLIVALVVSAFLLGLLTNKVMYLEKTTNKAPAATADQAQQQAAAPAVTITQDQITSIFNDKTNIIFGDKNSKNLIVEIADPSCPYCHVAAGHNPELNAQVGAQFKLDTDGGSYVAPVPKIKELVDSGKAAFAWIFFPGHGNGEMGTKAFYCAYEQGKFWEVHNKLMTNEGYNLLNNTVLNDKAKSQQLVDFLSGTADTSKLKACIDSGKYDSKLKADTDLSTALGVSGTPGFFINTNVFPGAYAWGDMQSAIK